MSALALTSLTLSHFRSHRRLHLDLDRRPVVLVGPNGIGKTNVLEAVSLLSPGRGLRRASADQFARQPEGIGWQVDAEFICDGVLHEVQTRGSDGSKRSVRLDGKQVPQVALGALVPMVWLVPAMDRLWIEAAEGRRRFLDRLTLSFCPNHARAVLDYDKAMRDRNRLLKDGVRDPHWYRALEAQMAQSGAEITDNRLACLEQIREAQNEAQTAFPIADLAIESPDQAYQPGTSEALEECLADGRAQDLAAGRTLRGPHRNDLSAIYAAKGLPARECSTGEQKALLISLILAAARAQKSRSRVSPIVLLDEVSAHLDRARQALLYDEIDVLGVQAWMTGTEKDLFTSLGDRAQHVSLPPESS